MILLQSVWMKKDDPVGLYIMLGVIVVAILVSFIIKASKGTLNIKVDSGFKPIEKKFSEGGFKRASKLFGFSDEQNSFLKKYAKKFSIGDAGFVFKNSQALDVFLKRVYQDVESHMDSEAQVEGAKTTLFSIREEVDRNRARGKPIKSTKEMKDGTAFSFITPDEENHPSKIQIVEASGLAAETPKDSTGTEIRFRRGTKIQCYFYAQGQQGYTFEGKILGYQTRGSRTLMIISHSDRVTALPNRLHIRRRLAVNCSFVRAQIILSQEGGKQQRKAIYDTRSIPGSIGDVSAGGISIKTSNPLADNEYLKVDFNIPGQNIEAVGKVVKTNRLRGMGGNMHLQFVKVSRKAINSILTYVYGYED